MDGLSVEGMRLNDQADNMGKAIRSIHGCGGSLIGRESVVEIFRGETVWAGEILIFELRDHPTATRCYAWEVNGRITAVLHEAPVDSPAKAVRAAIVAEQHRSKRLTD